MQLSLSDQFEPRPDLTFASCRRIELGVGAWLDFAPGWLSGHLNLMNELIATCDWQRHRRTMFDRVVEVPRLVAAAPGSAEVLNWDRAEVEVQRSRATQARKRGAFEFLAELATVLSSRYRRRLGSISLGYYRDGRDSVSFHGDKLGVLRDDTAVAIVSVGEARRFLLRAATGGPSRGFLCGGGDLMVMGGTCQRTFEHAVPKAKTSGPRIAIMFRERVPQRIPLGARKPVAQVPLKRTGWFKRAGSV